MERRRFIAIGGSASAAFFAGCAAADTIPAGEHADDRSAGDASTGTFRLLISDQPNAIGDFSELNVTFSSARVFRGDGADDDGGPDHSTATNDTASEVNGTDGHVNGSNGNVSNGLHAENESNGDEIDLEDVNDDDDDGNEGARGWVEIDLDGETVDLTNVVGDIAEFVAESELEEGQYSSIQLEVAEVKGFAATDDGDDSSDDDDDATTADQDALDDRTDAEDLEPGESLDVHVPSDRLRIVRPFEIEADEELSFVFDINVVRRGRQKEYNLLPVISKSGVVGEDVDVEELPHDGDDESSNSEADHDDDEQHGGPDDRGPQDDVPVGRSDDEAE